MHDRVSPRVLLLFGLLPFAGCTNALVDSISVTPTADTISIGQTLDFTATGTVGHGSNHPSTTEDVTDTATWTSRKPSVATVNAAGLATGVSAGTTTITATMNGYTGVTTASATLTVAGAGTGTGTVSGITGLTIIPGAQAVAVPGETSQFIAIGTTAAGSTVDMTNNVAWSSSSVQIGTVGATTGLATAMSVGSTTIIALYTNPAGGSTVTGTATFNVSAGSTEKYTAVALVPSSESVASAGQTGQFIALATSGTTGFEEDVTNSTQTKWTSSIPTIASVTSGQPSGNGQVSGVTAGTTVITVEVTNPDGSIVTAAGSATVTSTPAPEPLLSLTIIPSSLSISTLQGTGQFLAIGTFSVAPYTRDVTNSPSTTWLSSFPDYFPVDTNSGGTPSATAGIVTAYASGSSTIIAEYANPDGTIQTATATFNCPLALPNPTGNPPTPGSCYTGEAGPLKATLTVYGEGLNTTNWLVTAPSATGTPDVIHCGPGWAADGGTGGSVCVGIYPIGTTVTLTAPAQTRVNFGGWTYNCNTISPDPSIAAGPNTCTINLGTESATVGAIFN